MPQVQAGLSLVVGQLAGLYEGNLFLTHLFDFLAMPPAMAVPAPDAARPLPDRLTQGVEFRGVGFGYPDDERRVLTDVSFAIRPGQTVALVGENGAGKSTLVKLLTRLYDPTAGQILVDGVDLRELDLDAWRRRLGAVFQDFDCYHMTAGENIGLGRVDRLDDPVAVRAAAVPRRRGRRRRAPGPRLRHDAGPVAARLRRRRRALRRGVAEDRPGPGLHAHRGRPG